jgi:[NiFe] hydrogenase diaphorase moiety large subunit
MATNLETLKKDVVDICQKCGNDRTRMMDIVIAVQKKYGCVSSEAMDMIAAKVSAHRVEVESVVSFYAFLSEKQKGKVVIRVCDDIIDKMAHVDHIDDVFKKELGIDFGENTPDGKITLEHTPCIGMCDQAPAALINDVMVTNLSGDKVREIVNVLKETGDPAKITHRYGDGNNSNSLVQSMVRNHIRKPGEVIFSEYNEGVALRSAIAQSPVEVIRAIKASRLRGRGGAGFPTGMKWEFTRGAEGTKKTVICNADEGEPGTFKDRVILTERADLLFEGMTIAGYAIGADTGILYLRGEYAYLREYLEDVLNKRRAKGLLGKNVCSIKRFGLFGKKTCINFDIQIQMGAGAYICGEESALISSCEGLRGDPKTRPPFPAQKGYLETPTAVNNVETFCCIVKIVEKGAAWFSALGSEGSTGTKLFSVSGDCKAPGVYELPFGITVNELLEEVGAENTLAVQMGGPSGTLIGKEDFGRKICYDHLATGGAVMVFNNKRSILEIVDYFMEFFVEESCGFCTPCRVGNVLLKKKLEDIINGKGTPEDLDYLEKLGNTVKTASRCGLGQTSPNPILTSVKNFKSVYQKLVKPADDGMNPAFDIAKALAQSEAIAERKSVIFDTV